MKIEITSGTRKDPPMGINTFIKIDGKTIEFIDFFKFEVGAEDAAKWCMGFTPYSVLDRIKNVFIWFAFYIKRLKKNKIKR